MRIPVSRWDFAAWGSPGLDAVGDLHQPAENFRVSLYRYPDGTEFHGTAIASRWYILAGVCLLNLESSFLKLAAGEIADLPTGKYRLSVSGSATVELVVAWELPPKFRSTVF
ncbi:MAG: hypothetical protein U0835_16350 [Isosphaeraceae bacterium]